MTNNKGSRRYFFQKTVASSLGLMVAPGIIGSNKSEQTPVPENNSEEVWKNRQPGMTYRKLGRTGMMVSEIVMGTFPFNDKKYIPVIEAGVELGMNYIDTAAAYSQGQVETVMGHYFNQPGKRENVFVATKLSAYYGYLDRVLNDIKKGLTHAKLNALNEQAEQLIHLRRVKAPGYHINYFKNQTKQLNTSYLRHLILKEYGYQNKWKQQIKTHAYQLLDNSLKRLQTDYVDVLFCPHGIAMPEQMDDEILKELFSEFKQKGLIKHAAVSFHNDVTGNLNKAIDVGYYDLVMFAYNIANHAALDRTMYKAKNAGLGMIAMKVAKAIGMPDSPQWRMDKLNMAIPDTSISKYAKAYLWALQNPNLSCCVSQMETVDQINDNYHSVGKKINIQSV